MRLRVIHFFLSVPASGLSIASAETIHLNNGRIIVADRVQENYRYEYEIGEETYAIPKSPLDPHRPRRMTDLLHLGQQKLAICRPLNLPIRWPMRAIWSARYSRKQG